MKELREIIRIATSKSLKRIDIIEKKNLNDQKNVYSRLYRGIKSGIYQSDAEACLDLYGTEDSASYRMLKTRFRRRLLNTLFFWDLSSPAVNDYTRMQYFCRKNIICAQLLYSQSGIHSAYSLAKEILTLAVRYDFTDIQIQCLEIIQRYYSQSGLDKKFEDCCTRLHKAKETCDAERYAEEMLLRLTGRYSRSSALKPELKEEIKHCVLRIGNLLHEHRTYTLQLHFFRISSIFNEISRNYEGALKNCEEFEEFINGNKYFFNRARIAELALTKLSCLFSLRRYEECRTIISEKKNFFKQGGNNWFLLMEFEFLLKLHDGDYEDALEIYHVVTGHPRYGDGIDQRQERWKIFELYLFSLLYSLRKKLPRRGRTFVRSYDVQALLHELPIYSKDKRGANIAILIAHILLLLSDGDYEGIFLRTKALGNYQIRYLKKNTTYRSGCFIKMLMIMAANNCNYALTLQQSKKYYERISDVDPDYSGSVDTLEVIPYEKLWMIILAKLEEISLKNIKKKARRSSGLES